MNGPRLLSVAFAQRAMGIVSALLTLSIGTAAALAEDKKTPSDEPLVTDRPDFTESTDAVPVGRIQIEAGYTYTYDREGSNRVRSHTAPELLLRINLVKDVELRIGWDGYVWTDELFESRSRAGRRVNREDTFEGASDLSLGVKVKLFEQEGWLPHFGFIAGFSVPSGSVEVGSGDVDPEVVLLWAYDVNDRFAVAGNVGLAVPTQDAHRFVQTTASLSAALSLTDRLGSYIEYFGLYPSADSEDCAHSLNAGLTFLINNDFQLDWRIGFGLNEQADDLFTGVGFSWRF